MHELGVACSVYQACREAVAEQGPGRIVRVKLTVGELSAVEPDLIVFAWQAVTSDGPDQGAVLEVDWRPAEQHCPSCGEPKRVAGERWLPLCPDCGQILQVTGGTELEVVELTFETDDGETDEP